MKGGLSIYLLSSFLFPPSSFPDDCHSNPLYERNMMSSFDVSFGFLTLCTLCARHQ